MTAALFSWIVIGVNVALAALNAWYAWRCRQATVTLKHATTEMQVNAKAYEDELASLVARVLNGQVQVTADDGAVGILTVTPERDGMVRISVEPAPAHVLH
jgi:hypothetical protein